MESRELEMLQALPFEIKVAKSKLRIREALDRFGIDNMYIAFSGGKDSTVLMHLVRSVREDIPCVFSDTGLEYPELKEFVREQDNVITVRPKLSFKQVLERQGYPVVSKKTSRMLRDLQNPSEKNKITRSLYLSEYAIKNGELTDKPNNQFRLAEKWKYLIDAPFKISNRCCDIMKKNPFKEYEKETGKVPFIGTLAEESTMRKANYLRYGCNAFDLKHPHSTPLGFWTEQDILEYLVRYDLKYASVYGNIVKDENDKWVTTGENRTGCIFCMYGIHLEQGENRFERLKKTHPQLHGYCMDKLGFKEVCEFMNIKY